MILFSRTSEELDFDLAFDGLIDTVATGARDSPLIDDLKSKWLSIIDQAKTGYMTYMYGSVEYSQGQKKPIQTIEEKNCFFSHLWTSNR